jgi:DNA-binding transcriptional regulator/RsmH inhibitor MraZ
MSKDPPKAPPGRPPGWLLDADIPAPVLQEVEQVDNRGRVLVPARLAGGASWLKPGGEGLMVLVTPGRIILRPWDEAAETILPLRKQLVGHPDPDEQALETMRVLDDRYRRFRIEADGRLRLLPFAIAHLEHEKPLLFLTLIRLPSRLEIWSMRQRDEALLQVHDTLDSLP